ncbi:MAG: TolC family protein [Sphingomonadales bacterium]
MRIATILMLFAGFIAPVFAQDRGNINLGMVLKQVGANHPITKQAALLPKQGEAYLRYARGGFDPKLFFAQREKTFKTENYYNETSAGISIPTWYGVDIKAGYEKNDGIYLSPDMKTPDNGLSYAGVDIPLLRNMVTDARRTGVRQAQLFKEQSEAMRSQLLNELAQQVIMDYAGWYYAWQEKEIFRQAVILLNERMFAIRSEFLAGSKSAADTIETSAQLGSFNMLFRDAAVKEYKSRLMLSAHLWNEAEQPISVREGVIPDNTGLDFLDSMLQSFPYTLVNESLQNMQPNLQIMNLYVQKNQLEMRLNRQAMLPEINLKYRALSPGYFDLPAGNSMRMNSTFGMGFSSALFLRKERGEFELSRLAWQESGLKLKQKIRETEQKVDGLYREAITYASLSRDFAIISGQYKQLYEIEKTRFTAGDATVFMVNMRETRWIETLLKLNDYRQKQVQSTTRYLEMAGVIGRVF